MLASRVPEPENVPSSDWERIFREVNEWRGACMHHFTSIEYAVTQTLIELHAAKPENVRLRHLIGQRFEDLAQAIGPEGPFAGSNKIAHACLMAFRDRHEAFRTLLCHSQLTVSVEISGRWILVAENLSIRTNRADKITLVLRKSDAEKRLIELKKDGQKLSFHLGNLRRGLTDSEVVRQNRQVEV
jgi:hypothetical protein